MAASYPTAAKSFSTKSDGDTVEVADVNDLQLEMTAVENALLDGLAHDLLPDSTANTRDLGSTSKKWLDLHMAGDASIDGSVVIATDNEGVTLGGGGDATIQYDGTDLVVNSAAVGSGALSLTKGQLKFPATQNASSNANTLDDYEEGT